ncbi:MAG TPA: ACT domain-containing protein [Nevskiaceae bacterium]|nr:ACT domain-containing protein [Nevskiaceae bacterium]
MSLKRRLSLMIHPWRVVVERLPPTAAVPPAEGPFWAAVRTPESLTLVRSQRRGDLQPVWRALEIAGPFAFSETGVLAAVAQPLAEAGVSIFAVNSFETDFVLVQEPDLERARAALAAIGHRLAETEGP